MQQSKDNVKKNEVGIEKADEVLKSKEESRTETEKAKVASKLSFAPLAAKIKPRDKTELQNFEVKLIGDEARFMCDRCEYTGPSNKAVKGHWTRKHRREVQEEDEAKAKGKPVDQTIVKKVKLTEKALNYNIMDEFDSEGRPLDETMDETTVNETANETMETEEFIDLASTPKPKPNHRKTAEYEEELNTKSAEVESLREEVKQKQELLNIALATKASLEEADIEKSNELERAKKIMVYHKEKIEQLKKSTKGNDPTLRKELNEKNKEIKVLNQRLTDNLKTIRDETNLRAKAEADLIMKENTVKTLKEILEKRDSSNWQATQGRPTSPHEKRTELCRDFQRQGYCSRGSKCRFFHPPGRNQQSFQPDQSQKLDCRYWLEGFCKKEEIQCKGRHDPTKCGSKARRPRSPRVGNTETAVNYNNLDFVQYLAKAMSQGLVGVQNQAIGPIGGQQQTSLPAIQPAGFQPVQQQRMNQPQNMMMNQQNMMNQNQLQPRMMNNQQQPMMIPMMMMQGAQNMFLPNLQGGQDK